MDDNSTKPPVPAEPTETSESIGPTAPTETPPTFTEPTPIEPIVQYPITQPPVVQNKGGKKLFGKIGIVPAAIVLAVILIGGSAAAYFGYVLPNKPENIWEKALDNTAHGYDKLVEYVDEQKDVKGGKINGTFKFDSEQFVVDGNINGKYDEKTADINLDAGAAGTRVSLNILTNIPEGATSPDIYLKPEGLSGVGALLGGASPATSQMLASLDGKYYFIDHTLFDQYAKAMESGTGGIPELSPEDITAIAGAIGKVNEEYLFTTDENKAVLVVKSEVGKETVEGRDVYHYKVGYNKEHLKEYMTKLKEALKETKLKDLINDESFDQTIKQIDEMDGNGEADVWVDLKTKLIRTIRFSDEGNDSAYTDIGLLYEKGDEYPFYMTFKDEKEGEVTVKLVLNTKANTIKLLVDGGFKNGESKSTVKADITLETGDEKVEFKKPEGAQSLGDLIAPFLGGLSNPSLPINANGSDLNLE